MIFFAAALFGSIIGAFVSLVWWALEILIVGESSMHEMKFWAVVVICNALAQLFWIAIVAYEEIWANRVRS